MIGPEMAPGAESWPRPAEISWEIVTSRITSRPWPGPLLGALFTDIGDTVEAVEGPLRVDIPLDGPFEGDRCGWGDGPERVGGGDISGRKGGDIVELVEECACNGGVVFLPGMYAGWIGIEFRPAGEGNCCGDDMGGANLLYGGAC